MEKLQAALETARRKRAQQFGESAEPAPVPVHRHAGSHVAGLWDGLAPVEIDGQLIQHNRVLTMDASAAATPFDILRTKILLQMRHNGWKRLAITSPLPSCGKTTTACNLALGFGRQAELHSILCDLDLRSPSVARTLGIPFQGGMGDMLLGDVNFAQHGRRYGANLALAMSGTPVVDPTRVLLAPQTRVTLEQIEENYEPDLMIFDLPSILVGDDTRAFLQHVDCALIIARADQTKYAQFDACEREVGEYTNVLGVVLNGYRYGEVHHE